MHLDGGRAVPHTAIMKPEVATEPSWRTGVRHIGEVLDHNIVLHGADALTRGGYTRVPNHVLTSSDVSPGAKLVYAMLLRYAWQNDFCFPGQERLAKDMGAGERSVRNYLQELERQSFIEVRRRGQGRSNLYTLHLTVDKPKRRRS